MFEKPTLSWLFLWSETITIGKIVLPHFEAKVVVKNLKLNYNPLNEKQNVKKITSQKKGKKNEKKISRNFNSFSIYDSSFM